MVILYVSLKDNLKECVYVNSSLKIQCHIVKNTLLQTAFSAILPTGVVKIFLKEPKKFTNDFLQYSLKIVKSS